MAWFRVDDHLYGHPKWLGLPRGARALWTTAGSWASGQLTDGFIPTAVLPALDGTRREATALVEAGLWEEAEGGWLFHDWADFQPTRASVIEKRQKSAERLRKWREQKESERD
jgi:hypothetical protein